MAVTGLRTFQPFTYSHWNPTVVLVIPLYLHYYNSCTMYGSECYSGLRDIGVWRYLGFVILDRSVVVGFTHGPAHSWYLGHRFYLLKCILTEYTGYPIFAGPNYRVKVLY